MDIWQTLAILPTQDAGEIRRAYARQLKKHRPESDPVGYQQLREAYDIAKQRAQTSDGATNDSDEQQPAETIASPSLLETLSAADAFCTVDKVETLPEAEIFYTSEALQVLANQLVNTEMVGIVALNRLSAKVFKSGSLQQQQLFHQQLAAALAEVPGLTEGLLDRVGGMLQWGMDDYDNSHIIPLHIQHALQERLRETELNRAWKQLEAEEKHGMLLNRAAVRLLKSDRETVPFWIRLVPGMLHALARQANGLTHYYPEMTDRLNPAMLQFISQSRVVLSWQGIFLLIFWGLVFNAAIQISGINARDSSIAIATVVFYLYINDAILLGLHGKPRWFQRFLLAEFILSLMVVQLFFGGLFFAAVVSMPPSGHGGLALVAFIAILVLSIVFWAAWPKGVPFIRRPGMVMSRVLASPWKLLEFMQFSWFSAVWTLLCLAVFVLVITELLKLFA